MQGFEARGTIISKRILAHNNLFKEMPGIERFQTSSYIPTVRQPPATSNSRKRECTLEVLPYFASKTIFTSLDEKSLFDAKRLRDICRLENDIVRKQPLFENECSKPDKNSNVCCPSISIGYYAAVLRNKTSCLDITDEDVNYLKEVIIGMSLKNKTGIRPASNTEKAIVHSMMQFLVDKSFAASPLDTRLKYTLVFSPMQAPSRTLLRNMYEKKLQGKDLPKRDNVQLVAYDFENLKTVAYDIQLVADVWYIMLAVALIIGLMWGYSGSLFISIMGFSSVVFAIILSYWIYTVVFRLVFFPFLNIMTAIFVVGIGADDIFVYVLAWRHARQDYAEAREGVTTLAKCTEYALEHATAAMFVTSLTTATAFYAGLTSSITALQCFSIFAGTSILTNYFLMITWLPAVIIAQERFFEPIKCKGRTPITRVQTHPGTSALTEKELGHRVARPLCFPFSLSDIQRIVKESSDVVFQRWIAHMVVKLRYCWLAIFLIIAMFGLLSLTYYPKLSLPTTQQMPLFTEDHTIERYDSKIKSQLKIEELLSTDRNYFPITFVWGAKDVDNGYFLNPSSTGSTEWDPSFNLTNEESQIAMLEFCKNIRSAPFYHKIRNGRSWCFMEGLQEHLRRNCSELCCSRKLPLKPNDFMRCTKEYMYTERLKRRPIKLYDDGRVKAIVLRFESTQTYEMKYGPVAKFWETISKWTDKEMGKMPVGLRDGWVVSSMYFYDLQKSIADGTIKTIAVSIGISAIVLLATTQNIIITVYAVIAITAIISVTIGSLVMAGWRLNVLESMMMSVAIGLSIDFTLHYGVAYFSCDPSQSRKERVHHSLWHVGSAVAMGTVTTFLAGML